MVFSLLDVVYVTIGILFVVKYFAYDNIKKPNSNTTNHLARDDNNKIVANLNDGDRIILYYHESGDSSLMDYNYDVKYDILNEYNITNYSHQQTDEIEVIYM